MWNMDDRYKWSKKGKKYRSTYLDNLKKLYEHPKNPPDLTQDKCSSNSGTPTRVKLKV